MDPMLQHHPCREGLRAVFNKPSNALKWTLSNGKALSLFLEKIRFLLSVTLTNLLPQCPISKVKVSVLGTPQAVSATSHDAFKQTRKNPAHCSGAFFCLLVSPDAPSRDVFLVCGHKAFACQKPTDFRASEQQHLFPFMCGSSCPNFISSLKAFSSLPSEFIWNDPLPSYKQPDRTFSVGSSQTLFVWWRLQAGTDLI